MIGLDGIAVINVVVSISDVTECAKLNWPPVQSHRSRHFGQQETTDKDHS
jgi:hypothetical protein